MKAGEFQSGINAAWDLVCSVKLGLTFSCPVSLEVDDEFRDLCLAGDTPYTKLFLCGLEKSYYNFMLVDYSYFHFGQDGDDELRYAYYPNPFVTGHEDELARFRRLHQLVVEEMITYEEYLVMLQGGEIEARVPSIRYENSPSQYKRLSHPCSHMHIGHHSENRWAVRRILTPKAFVLLIVKHYYSDVWASHGEDLQNTFGNLLEEELAEEKQKCRIVSDGYFVSEELRSFFFFA